MAFELAESTAVTITNANPRRELHGDEKVRAIDISFTLKGENILLDLLEPGLREHHYFNKAVKDGQVALPGVLIPLPNLRHPCCPPASNTRASSGGAATVSFGTGALKARAWTSRTQC